MNSKYSIVVDAATDAARRELEKLGKSAETSFDRARVAAVNLEVGAKRAFGDMASRFQAVAGRIAAAGAAITGAGLAAKHFVESASGLQEAQNKVNVIFGEGAGAMTAWAQHASTSLGLSTRAALSAAGGMGNMWQQLGATTAAAMENSRAMIKLSADLASFHNAAGGAEEVLQDIQSAFRGEYDPIQKYIPTINAAAVEHEALARTGKTAAKELTALEKAVAAQAIILRDAGKATGDFARTSTEYANAGRIMGAQIEDLSAKIGAALLPAATGVVGQLSAWVAANDKLIGQKVAEYVDGITGSVKSLHAVYSALPDEVIGAAGYGIVGRMLFGNWGAGAALAWLANVNTALREMRDKALAGPDGVNPEVGGGILGAYRANQRATEQWEARNMARGERGALDRAARGSLAVQKAIPAATTIGATADLWLDRVKGMAAATERSLLLEYEAEERAIKAAEAAAKSGADRLKSVYDSLKADQDQVIDRILRVSHIDDKTMLGWRRDQEAARIEQETDLYRRAAQEQEEVIASKNAVNMISDDQWKQYVIQSYTDQVEKAKQSGRAMVDLSRRTAEAMEENFSDFFFSAMRGEFDSFADYADAVLQSLQRALADYMGQLARAALMGDEKTGSGGLVGWAIKGITGLVSGIGAGAAATVVDTGGASVHIGAGGTTAVGMHAGGLAGRDATFTRTVPESLFAGAPRLHQGLAADEFPAILQRGETVIPRGAPVAAIPDITGALAKMAMRLDEYTSSMTAAVLAFAAAPARDSAAAADVTGATAGMATSMGEYIAGVPVAQRAFPSAPARATEPAAAMSRIGETVLPRGSAPAVNIVVNNRAAGTEASVRQSGDGLDIEILIEQVESAIGGRMRRNTGLAPMLDARYRRAI